MIKRGLVEQRCTQYLVNNRTTSNYQRMNTGPKSSSSGLNGHSSFHRNQVKKNERFWSKFQYFSVTIPTKAKLFLSCLVVVWVLQKLWGGNVTAQVLVTHFNTCCSSGRIPEINLINEECWKVHKWCKSLQSTDPIVLNLSLQKSTYLFKKNPQYWWPPLLICQSP